MSKNDSDVTVNLDSSEGSSTDIHELDPDYDGPCYPSQACFGCHAWSALHSTWVEVTKSQKKEA